MISYFFAIFQQRFIELLKIIASVLFHIFIFKPENWHRKKPSINALKFYMCLAVTYFVRANKFLLLFSARFLSLVLN